MITWNQLSARQQFVLMAKRPLVVYVAGPITSSGNIVENIARGEAMGATLLRLGYSPIVPHSNSHWPVAPEDQTFERYLMADVALVGRADAVLRLPGPSEGADLEVFVAREDGIPVFDSVDDLERWKQGQS